MTSLSHVFRGWFTGNDNQNYEVGRALWALSVLAGIGYAGFDIFWNHSRFNMVEFGTGLGSLLALGGVGLAVKDGKPLIGGSTTVTTGGPTVVAPPQQQGGE